MDDGAGPAAARDRGGQGRGGRKRHSPHPAWIDGQCGPTLLHVVLTI
jgi:hypothetical protein